MKTGIDLQVNLERPINDVLLGFDKSDKKIDKAVKRAIKKLITWLRRQIAKQIAQQTGIVQKAMKSRYQLTMLDDYALLWIGLNPVEARYLSRRRQTSSGVVAGGHEFKSAFIGKVYDDTEKVWIRSSKNKQHNYSRVSNRKRSGNVPDTLKGRFPVELIGVDVFEKGHVVVSRIQTQAEARFKILLLQEINFAFKHEN